MKITVVRKALIDWSMDKTSKGGNFKKSGIK